jgi:hypothetical protein
MTIARKTREINTTCLEQQTISDIALNTTDKAYTYYNQLTMTHLAIALILVQMEKINLQSPEVTTTNENNVFQLTKRSQNTFK